MSDEQMGLRGIKATTKSVRCKLYVDYGEDLEAAFNAANVLATASKEPAAVFTAMYGVVNTLCNVIDAKVDKAQTDLTNVRNLLEEAWQLVDVLKAHIQAKEQE